MDILQIVLMVFQLFLAFCNACIMLYIFKGFVSKPHNELEERVKTLEVEHREIKERLLKGNDKFREQNETNEVLLHSTLALIEFEIQFCLLEHKSVTPELQKAKDSLHDYLSKR